MPPRRISAHLHDRFQYRVISITVGATTYQAAILLSLPAASGSAAPVISTFVSVAIGVASIAALLVAIRYAERATRPAFLVADAARHVIDRIRHLGAGEGDPVETLAQGDDVEEHVITAPQTGWVQQVDSMEILRTAPEGAHVRLQVGPGGFVVRNYTPVCMTHGAQPSEEEEEGMQQGIEIADARPPDLDLVGYATEFCDIAVHTLIGTHRSISTMYETIGYLGAILHALTEHDLRVQGLQLDGGRTLQRGLGPDGAGLADMCIDRIRQASADEPVVALEMVRILLEVRKAAVGEGRSDIERVLDHQADLIVAQCKYAGGFPPDVERVAAAQAAGSERKVASASS